MCKTKYLINIFRFVFGYCKYCGKYFKYPKWYRESTLYESEQENWHKECEGCFNEHEFYWEEQWNEYNSERL